MVNGKRWEWYVVRDGTDERCKVVRDLHGVEVAARGMTLMHADAVAGALNVAFPARCEWPGCVETADHEQDAPGLPGGVYCGAHMVGGG